MKGAAPYGLEVQRQLEPMVFITTSVPMHRMRANMVDRLQLQWDDEVRDDLMD